MKIDQTGTVNGNLAVVKCVTQIAQNVDSVEERVLSQESTLDSQILTQ